MLWQQGLRKVLISSTLRNDTKGAFESCED